jgi:hypothetical protein
MLTSGGSMKKNIYSLTCSLALAAAALTATGCNQGAGSFSVLSETTNFEQKATYTPRKLDVLFIVDNSGSMSTSQQNLVDNFSSFIDRFISKGYDFRIAVATTEAYIYPQFVLPYQTTGGSPCINRCEESRARFRTSTNNVTIIDHANYDLTQASERARLKNDFSLNAVVGTTGSGDERSLSSFQEALAYQPNQNFHRSDAFLSVVVISDEEDFSQSGYTWNESYFNPLLTPVNSYKSFLETFTGGQAGQDFSVSSITVMDDACRILLNNGQKIANRVMALADATGGTKNSICAPFDTSLDNISTSIESQAVAEFILPKTPVVSSIRLIVDTTIVPQSDTNGWSYNPLTKAVRINGATYKPGNGSQIKLNYDPDLNSL